MSLFRYLKLTILVFLYSIVLQSTNNKKLAVDKYLKLLSSRHLNVADFEEITLSQPKRFELRSQYISKDKHLISIKYIPSTSTFFSFKIFKKKTVFQTLNYNNHEVAFICYQFLVYSSMPYADKFYRIVNEIANRRIRGLAQIMSTLNVVEWTDEMLDYFYSEIEYPKFYYTKESSFAKQLRFLDTINKDVKMVGNEPLMNISLKGFDYSTDSMEKKIISGMKRNLRNLLKRIYSVIKQDTFFDIHQYLNSKHQTKLTAEQKSANQITIVEFNELMGKTIRQNLKMISSALLSYEITGSDLQFAYNMYDRYHIEVAPIFGEQLYTLLQVLLIRFRKNYLIDKGESFYKYMKEVMEIVPFFEPQRTIKKKFAQIMIQDFLYDKFEEFDWTFPKNNSFVIAVRQALKNIFNTLNANLPRVPGSKNPEVSRVKNFLIKDFLKKYLMKSPFAMAMIYTIVHNAKFLFFSFSQSPLMTNRETRLSDSEFVDGICKAITKLGVYTPVKPKTISLKFKMFKLENTNANMLI